jgi:polygalacturonase
MTFSLSSNPNPNPNRRPGYWTVHPTFCNNVRVTGNSIITTGSNTDGCDPDSTWNVYISENDFSTGDDCIAIKAGRDWSGRMVNISTQNVLVENNKFLKVYKYISVALWC